MKGEIILNKMQGTTNKKHSHGVSTKSAGCEEGNSSKVTRKKKLFRMN